MKNYFDFDDYSLKKDEKLYLFGVDWGSEYYHWHFVAKSHEIISVGQPIHVEQLAWVV